MGLFLRALPVFRLLLILAWLFTVTEGRPETNFASSSITSDNSGTRSSHLVGTVPDSSSQYNNPNVRLGNSGGGSGQGATILTRNGVAGTSTSGNGGFGGSSSSILSRTSSGNNGEAVGLLTRSGPGGTQNTIISPGYNQPVISTRYGGEQPVYIGSGSGFPGASSGASSGAFAGPSGASAGAFAGAGAGGVSTFAGGFAPDYYGHYNNYDG